MFGLQCDGVALEEPMKTEETGVVERRSERRFHWQSSLLLESVRRQTFTSWNVSFVSPDQLAAAGFFYLRTQDHVQCVFCQGIVGFWEPGDQPEVEHQKHFPRCPFVTGAATGNVPIPPPDSCEPRHQLYDMLNQYHAFKVASTRPHHPPPNTTSTSSTPYQTDATRVGGSGGQMAFPHLNTPNSRLATFTRWPHDIGVGGEELAEAGFFSTGLADWVQCFHCGGGLFGWRRGDDPLHDHARYYPFCPFVRMKYGQVKGTLTMPCLPPTTDTSTSSSSSDPMSSSCHSTSSSSPARPLILTEEEAELLQHHPIAKRLVDMGLSKVSVREALKRRVEVKGVLCRSVTEALELVFDYEEDQRRNKTLSTTSHDGPQQQQIDTTLPTSSTMTSAEDTNTHIPSNQSKLIKEVEDLRRQVEEEEGRLLCRVCGKERVAIVFQPCSHLHLCAPCARPRDTCFTCGTIIRGTFRPIIG